MNKEDLNEQQKIAYDIVQKQMEKEIEKIRTNPLFQEWQSASFRDMLIYGEDTPETKALYKKFKESIS